MKWKTRGQRAILALLAGLILAGAVSWFRSYAGTPHGVSWRLSGARYTLRAVNGRVELRGPPPAPAAAAEAAARVVSRVSWTDFDWKVSVSQRTWFEGSVEPMPHLSAGMISPTPFPATPGAEAVGSAKDPPMTRALLDALDDPDRFALAHLCLAANGGAGVHYERHQGDRLTLSYQGLTLELQALMAPPRVYAAIPGRRPKLFRREGGSVRARVVMPVDPRQMPDLRTRWHDLLAVRRGAVPHWVILAVLSAPSVLFAARVARAARRRRRRRGRGECEACGYDLRASSGRCPECGREAPRGTDETVAASPPR